MRKHSASYLSNEYYSLLTTSRKGETFFLHINVKDVGLINDFLGVNGLIRHQSFHTFCMEYIRTLLLHVGTYTIEINYIITVLWNV